jgi:hypothetical protein
MTGEENRTITCIYCKQERARPARGEHIILDALGGRTTIRDVCGGPGSCNQQFGNSIDRELVRNSLVAVPRTVGHGGRARDHNVFYFREDHRAWIDIVLHVHRTGRRELSVLPQLYLYNGRAIVVASPRFAQARDQMLSLPVDALEAAVTKRLIEDHSHAEPSRIIFQPDRACYVARARSEATYAQFLASLRTELPALVDHLGREPPHDVVLRYGAPMALQLWIGVNDTPRCAAKMAFNFMCHMFGPDVALRPEFDSVRDYITGRYVEPVVSHVSESGEAGFSVDTRHVANWMAPHEGVPPPPALLRSAHYIILLAHRGEVGAEVGLYGGLLRFAVSLGHLPSDFVIETPLPVVFMTPINGGGDRVLVGGELVASFMESDLGGDA